MGAGPDCRPDRRPGERFVMSAPVAEFASVISCLLGECVDLVEFVV
jgi:hypothetical protein